MAHHRPSSHFGDATSPATSPLQTQPPTEVIPRLYVGDLAAAESPEVLTALGITHVLSVMPGHVALPPAAQLPHLLAARRPALERMQLPLHDTPFAELADALPRTTAFIAQALRGDPAARFSVIHAGVFQAMGVISFAFVCHHNSLLIYGSLRTPTLDRFARVTHISTAMSLVACCTLAISGYVVFTDKTQGNILNNFAAVRPY